MQLYAIIRYDHFTMSVSNFNVLLFWTLLICSLSLTLSIFLQGAKHMFQKKWKGKEQSNNQLLIRKLGFCHRKLAWEASTAATGFSKLLYLPHLKLQQPCLKDALSLAEMCLPHMTVLLTRGGYDIGDVLGQEKGKTKGQHRDKQIHTPGSPQAMIWRQWNLGFLEPTLDYM